MSVVSLEMEAVDDEEVDAASTASAGNDAACPVADALGSGAVEGGGGASAVSFVSSFWACCTTDPRSFLAASSAFWLYSIRRVPDPMLSAVSRG